MSKPPPAEQHVLTMLGILIHIMLCINPNPLLTVSQVATYLNVKESFVRDLVKQRRIEVTKIGDLVRIQTSECERIIREGTRPARVL